MIITEVEKEFQEYSKTLLDPYDKSMEINQLKVRTDIAYLEVYYFFLNFIADKEIMNYRHRSEQILYAKISSDLLGILTNLSVGCISQAMIILRSLLETTIYAKFICEKPDVRLNLYADFSIVQKQKLNEKDGRTDDDLKRQFELIKHKYDVQKQWYTKHLLEIIRSSSAYRNKKPSIRTLSFIIGMQDDYDKLYSVLSQAGHGNAILENIFIQNNRFNAAPTYLPYWNELIARMSVNYASKGIKSILMLNPNEDVKSFIEYSEVFAYKVVMESNVNQSKEEKK
jgi:hypothetical protein